MGHYYGLLYFIISIACDSSAAKQYFNPMTRAATYFSIG